MAPESAAHLVRRTLKITAMTGPPCEAAISAGLLTMDGVEKVVTRWRKELITVTYDLQQVRLEEIEEVLMEIGYPPDPGFLHRRKRDLMRFAEQNEVDNLNHDGHCCSKPPIRH